MLLWLKAVPDIILIETVFDTPNAKAAILRWRACFEAIGFELPIAIFAPLPMRPGRTLSGQTAEAFYNSIRHAKPISIGLTGALGADALKPHIKTLSDVRNFCFRSPNAGLPNEFGANMTKPPEQTATMVADYAKSGLVNIVGGCCGTTPNISPKLSRWRHLAPRQLPDHKPACRLSGLEAFNITRDSLFVNIVGERTNVTELKRNFVSHQNEQYTEALDVARDQVEGGAQIVDINMDEAMLDSKAAMIHFVNLVASEPDISRVPLMIDSSKWDIIEAGLKCTRQICGQFDLVKKKARQSLCKSQTMSALKGSNYRHGVWWRRTGGRLWA